MSTRETLHGARSHWPVIAALAMVVIAGSAAYWRWTEQRMVDVAVVTPPASRVAAVVQPPPPAPPVEATVYVPSFDVVRVGPGGQAVIAGRAEPGAEVRVLDGDRIIGRVRADANGEFVLLPDAPLVPGGRELTLVARGADGKELRGTDSVVVVVPEPAVAQSGPVGAPVSAPVAVLLPQDAPTSRVLQAPPAGKEPKLALSTVDYDETGEIRFAGTATPSAPVRIYVDNQPTGETQADAAGQWTSSPRSTVTPGVHRLRLDQLGRDGKVTARLELPFQRTVAPTEGLAAGQAVVQPGENLWRIARHTYGFGIRYTVIYLANKEQIRDPRRIYPGQIFNVPPRP